MVSRATKRRKTANLEAQDPDLLNNLPEGILSDILSFLSAEDAVRTSVLSKKWEFLWASTSDEGIYVSDKCFYQREKSRRKQLFIDFLNRKLEKLSASDSPIRCLNLRLLTSFKSKNNPYPMTEWIKAILSLLVQKLCVHYFDGSHPYHFPVLFTHCDSLVELELKLLGFVHMPSTSFLRNLKSFKFSGVHFVRNVSSRLPEIVLEFPKLKKFEAHRCMWLKLNNIILKTPRLESFVLLENIFTEYPEFNMFCFTRPWKTTFKICAPNLREFHYTGLMLEDIILSNPLSVVDVSIDIYSVGNKDQAGEIVCNFLRQFHRVEVLKLGCSAVEVLAHATDHVSKTLPEFQGLVSLVIDLNDYWPCEKILLYLLHKSPTLKSLQLLSDLPTFDKRVLAPERRPPCLIAGLKSVNLAFFEWNVGNRCLAKYLLEHAEDLEQLTISLYMTKGIKRAVREQLLASPIASNHISIKVEKTPMKSILQIRKEICSPSF